ncbi:MAG: branched-chain amino acid aminotransferase [Desulfobacterota bacterium]|jgi:branched-chain amino acid aminotransferase|nr:branched-chain amino acid aminotransferase [Thermodesulfobacteriota bacterium]
MEISITKSSTIGRKARPKSEAELGFGKYFTDHMFLMDYEKGQGWINPRIVPYGPLSLDPSAMVLHYGQEIFEGLKAYRWTDGTIALFRPDKNIERWNRSARRLCMAETDPELFLEGMKTLILLDRDWIPSSPGTSLYIRPTMIATEAALGVKPSSRYLFFIIIGPVGPYYPEGFSPTRIYVTKSYVRAARGGVGETKTGGNYAASLYAATRAQELGFTQVLWLDAAEHKYVEEVGTSNIFFRIGEELITPPLAGTILPGVTRDSVLFLAREWGITVNERPITIDEVIQAAEDGRLKEMFATGTAAVISPVGEIGYQDRVIPVADGKTGPLAQRLYDEITGIQYGQKPDPYGWVVKIG